MSEEVSQLKSAHSETNSAININYLASNSSHNSHSSEVKTDISDQFLHAPLQPKTSSIPKCSFEKNGKIINQFFQGKWFRLYPLLNYNQNKLAFTCFYCIKAAKKKRTAMGKILRRRFFGAWMFRLETWR